MNTKTIDWLCRVTFAVIFVPGIIALMAAGLLVGFIVSFPFYYASMDVLVLLISVSAMIVVAALGCNDLLMFSRGVASMWTGLRDFSCKQPVSPPTKFVREGHR